MEENGDGSFSCLNLRLNGDHDGEVLHLSSFRKNGRTFGRPPSSSSELAPTIRPRATGMWVTGLSLPCCLVARPSSLPEAFPTNCSSERTTTKNQGGPGATRECNSSLSRAQKFRRKLPMYGDIGPSTALATSIFQDSQENYISCVFAVCHLG